ncbi:MAG TPA: hypothetical protein P5230_00280 [Candidatus Magasanikbacteria bacterium]|nr:hypothetical protein [Candidatus Magasanikbacteria bacterium]
MNNQSIQNLENLFREELSKMNLDGRLMDENLCALLSNQEEVRKEIVYTLLKHRFCTKFGYDREYLAIVNKDHEQQVELGKKRLEMVLTYFPELKFVDNHIFDRPLGLAEGYFVFPKWEKIAGSPSVAAKRIDVVLEETKQASCCSFHNLELRVNERTREMYKKLCEQQKGDVLIVPAQLGGKHRDISVVSARDKFADNEFGLMLYMGGLSMLTTPELTKPATLFLNYYICCGENYLDGEMGLNSWNHSPIYFQQEMGGRLRMTLGGIAHEISKNGDYHERYGCMTGFVPE